MFVVQVEVQAPFVYEYLRDFSRVCYRKSADAYTQLNLMSGGRLSVVYVQKTSLYYYERAAPMIATVYDASLPYLNRTYHVVSLYGDIAYQHALPYALNFSDVVMPYVTYLAGCVEYYVSSTVELLLPYFVEASVKIFSLLGM